MTFRSARHRLEYLAVAAIAGVVRILPRRAVAALGTLLGLGFYLLDGPHRRLAIGNLHAAFPERSARDCRRIARATFGHFGRLALDFLTFSALPADRMLSLVEFEGRDRVEEAHARGRGVLYFTGHFGFWELHAIVHAVVHRPISVVARPLDNERLNILVERLRTCTANAVIYRQGSLRRVLRALEANEGVALLIDQHIQSGDAVMVDFFDRPAATTSALAALALRTGATVLPVFALPLAGGRYRMVYERPVELPEGEGPGAVAEFTQRCTDVLEAYVRRHPPLWLWMHRRWREIGVAGEAVGGMFPAAARDEP